MGVCGWHLTVVSKSSMYSFPLSPSSSNRACLRRIEGGVVERQRADTLTRCKREKLWRRARPGQALFTHTALGVSSTVGVNNGQTRSRGTQRAHTSQ
jgi:hypothetical protein